MFLYLVLQYQLLQELGAVTEERALTPVGQELAKLPLDPRVARMIVAARDEGCLKEMLIIAAALTLWSMLQYLLAAWPHLSTTSEKK